MNNWLAFKMLIHIFTSVSVKWRDVKRMRHTANYGKEFEDDNETLKTPGSPKHTFTVSIKDLLDLRSFKEHLN